MVKKENLFYKKSFMDLGLQEEETFLKQQQTNNDL